MPGFEGFISIVSNNGLGSLGSDPQALFVDQETLSFKKDIVRRPNVIKAGRQAIAEEILSKAEKPAGEIAYSFRSSDALKVLYSHFQSGTQFNLVGSVYTYNFYSSKNFPRNYSGTNWNRGAYGFGTGDTYTVSVIKKAIDTSSGPNSFLFKNGVCDKLTMRLQSEKECQLAANFLFRDLDHTYTSDEPPSVQAGSYATTPGFLSYSATLYYQGRSFDVTSLEWTSDQAAQEITRVGRRDPECYLFGDYSVKGNFSFDLPSDAMRQIGSMFGTNTFSIQGTLVNSDSDRVYFSLPSCVRLPFDYNNQGGDQPLTAKVPFEAFELRASFDSLTESLLATDTLTELLSAPDTLTDKMGLGLTAPVTVTVDTDYAFQPLMA